MDVKIVHPILIFTPRKLKHRALKDVHYQLINTCLIISSVGWRYCNCWDFSGCRDWPSHTNLHGNRNNCYICQIKKTFNLDKMYKLVKIQEVFNTFLELKKDLQIFLDNGLSSFWLYDYSVQFIYNRLNDRKRKHIQSWTVNILKANTHTHCSNIHKSSFLLFFISLEDFQLEKVCLSSIWNIETLC